MTLSVGDLSFRYGTIVALTEVSLEVGAGVTALLGVNGAGKSTLLSICAGLLPPDRGTVLVGDRALWARRSRREALRHVALMPQQAAFPANLTAHDVVRYLGWLKGLSSSAASRRAGECLERVGLSARAGTRCGALSGGMQRRVALAQALVSEPDVLLLDEPSTGLDPEQRRAMVELIRTLPGTVVLSSHVVEDIEDLAERVVILDAGRSVFDGTVAELTAGLDDVGRRSPVEVGFFRAIGRPVHA